MSNKPNQKTEMEYTKERLGKKLFIGLEMRTNNADCSVAMPSHKDKFFRENIPAKIPNRTNDQILALYTDYEGDHTQSYSWILGCEVSSLEIIPEGLVGKTIPQSTYALYTTQGDFPQGLIAVWQAVWSSAIPRAYTSDFEVYPADFDPQKKPQIRVYIAMNERR